MFEPTTLEATAVKFIVNEDIPTSPEELHSHLHLLIERMRKIRKQKERIVYFQERWWVLFCELVEADEKRGMYESLVQYGSFDDEKIGEYERRRVLYAENTRIFNLALVENDQHYDDECVILKSLEHGLEQEYKEMNFDTSYVKYILALDPQFTHMIFEIE